VAFRIGGAADLELRPAVADETDQVAGVGKSVRMRAEAALALRRVAAQGHDGGHVFGGQPVEDLGEIHLRVPETGEVRHGVQRQVVLQRRHQVYRILARAAAGSVGHRNKINVQARGLGQRRIQPRPALRRLGRKEFKRDRRAAVLDFFEKGHGSARVYANGWIW